MSKVEREKKKNEMARIMRVEIEDIKTQFYYSIDFKQQYRSRMGFPKDAGVRAMGSLV